MYAGKKSSLLQWEKVLQVMLSGKPVNKEILEAMPEMEDVPMYRLSSFIYHVKLAGGVVKVIKDGRKIDKYELVNIKDMVKYLEKREKSFSAKAPVKAVKPVKAATSNKKVAKKVEKLSDLDAQVSTEQTSAPVADELVVTEITQ